MKTLRLPGSSVLIVALSLFFTTCQKKYAFDVPGIAPLNPVSASLSGRVTDLNHLPVNGATVKSGSASTTTDLNGYFRFNKLTINNPDIAFVKVEKAGFFTGSRTYQTAAGSNGYVAIQLIKKTIAGTFTGISGGVITVPDNGGTIAFQANSITSSLTNTSYAGTVSVAAFFINPAVGDFQEMMPGSLLGLTTDNKQVGLQSYGMLAVELTGATGEKLQLSTGKSATLGFPIPSGLQSQAPSSIPLWSFDESTGLWKQDGIATRQGNNYTGTVSHFSFWNCDFPFPVNDFKGTLVNQNGLPLPHLKVVLRTIDDGITTSGYGYSDSAGIIAGKLPSGKTFLMTVYSKCGDPIDVRHIGPFVNAVNLGTLAIKTTAATVVRFTGKVVNCTGSNIVSGFVDILLDNNHYFSTVANGNFSMTVARCNSNSTVAFVTGYDDANITQSIPAQITVADTIVNTGQLTACGNALSQFFNYKLNGVSGIFTHLTDSISVNTQSGQYSIWFSRRTFQSPAEEVNLVFAAPTTGITPLTGIYVQNNNSRYSLKTAANITITENGPAGGYVSGNFAADLKKDSVTTTYPITASFRFKK